MHSESSFFAGRPGELALIKGLRVRPGHWTRQQPPSGRKAITISAAFIHSIFFTFLEGLIIPTMAGNYVTQASVMATGITMVVLSSLIAGLRLFLSMSEQRKFQWEDGWLVAAYVFFLVLSILYLVATPTMFRVAKVASGDMEPYPSIAEDGLFIQKTFFVTTSGLWLCLWAVKLSLMAVYKRLMAGLKHYIRIWWAVIVFCLVVCHLTTTLILQTFNKARF